MGPIRGVILREDGGQRQTGLLRQGVAWAHGFGKSLSHGEGDTSPRRITDPQSKTCAAPMWSGRVILTSLLGSHLED